MTKRRKEISFRVINIQLHLFYFLPWQFRFDRICVRKVKYQLKSWVWNIKITNITLKLLLLLLLIEQDFALYIFSHNIHRVVKLSQLVFFFNMIAVIYIIINESFSFFLTSTLIIFGLIIHYRHREFVFIFTLSLAALSFWCLFSVVP
jgi:hypothetical protein